MSFDHDHDHGPWVLPRPTGRSPMRLAHSNITAVNNLGPVPRIVIHANPSRTGITFHNPGMGAVLVFPEFVLIDGRNHRLTPTLTQLGGGFLLQYGATLFIGESTAQQAWQGLALAGLVNPLTIQEQTGATG